VSKGSSNGRGEQQRRTFSLDRLHETPAGPGQREIRVEVGVETGQAGQGRATTGTRSYCGTIGMLIQALGAYFCRRTFLRWGEGAVSWSVCASTAGGSFMARWVAWAWA
jgi:hypothetical protein